MESSLMKTNKLKKTGQPGWCYVCLVVALLLGGCSRDLESETRAAYSLLDQGKPILAEEKFRAVLLKDGAHGRATLGRAKALREQGNWASAYAWFLRAVALDPGNNEAIKGALELEIRAQHWSLAYQRFPLVHWQDPVKEMLTLAQIEAGLGKEAAALQRLQDGASLHPALLPDAAMMARKLGKLALAQDLLSEAKQRVSTSRSLVNALFFIEKDPGPLFSWLDENPGDKRLTVLAVEYHLRTGALARASKQLESYAGDLYETPELSVLQLEVFALQKRLPELDEFTASMSVRNATWDAIRSYGRGLLALENSEFTQALRLLKIADRGISGRGRLQVTIGLLAYASSDWSLAYEYLHQGLLSLPYIDNARIALADVSLRTGDVSGAMAQAKVVLSRMPDSPPALKLLAYAKARQGDTEGAYHTLTRIDPGQRSNEELSFAGELLLKLGHFEDAELITETIAANDNEALLVYVDALVAQGRTAEARSWLSNQQLPLARQIEAILALRGGDITRALELTAPPHANLGAEILRVVALDSAGQSTEALSLAMSSQAPAMKLKAGGILANQGAYERARALYEQLLQDASGSPLVLHNLARVMYQQDEELDQARILARRAHLQMPEKRSFEATLADINKRIEDKKHEINKPAAG